MDESPFSEQHAQYMFVLAHVPWDAAVRKFTAVTETERWILLALDNPASVPSSWPCSLCQSMPLKPCQAACGGWESGCVGLCTLQFSAKPLGPGLLYYLLLYCRDQIPHRNNRRPPGMVQWQLEFDPQNPCKGRKRNYSTELF